jgi:hypothetical protein
MVKTKLAPNACAERKRLPRFTGFEMPSTPMAKYPRGAGSADFMALSWKFSGPKAPATVKAGNCPYNFRVPSPTFARLFRGLALTRRFSGGSMTGTANSFGQEALDFVESLDRVDTSDAVLDTMQGAISRFGFEWVAFAGILPRGRL